MRNVRLWRGLLGVDQGTVIEDIEFEEFEEEDAEGDRWWWRGCGREVVFRGVVAAAAAGRPGMTGVRVGADGGAWIGARCRWCWRPRPRG